MESISRNQLDTRRRDLSGLEARKRIRETADEARTCFFCTRGNTGPSHGVRPMSVLEADAAAHLWFLSAIDSHKNAELAVNPEVRLVFQRSSHAGFMELEGTATVSQDRARIRQLWDFVLKTWFAEGENDPRISVIEVVPREGYYWDNKHGQAVAGARMLVGAAIGKSLDDAIEGRLTP